MDDLFTYAIYAVVMVIWLLRTVSKSSKNSKKAKQRQQKIEELLESPRKRRGHTITLRNVSYHRDHPSMIAIVKKYSGWDASRAKSFLYQNEFLQIHNQAPYESVSIMSELNRGKIKVERFTRNPNEDEIVLKRVKAIQPASNYYKPEPTPSPTQPEPESHTATATQAEPQVARKDYKSQPNESMTEMSRRMRRLSQRMEQTVRSEEVRERVEVEEEEEDTTYVRRDTRAGLDRLIDDRSDLVKGIILSEVLGKPVSER